jgi:amidase
VNDAYPEALGDRSFLKDLSPITDVVIAREIERNGELIGRPLTEDDVEWTSWEMVKRADQVTGRAFAACVDELRYYAGKVERWWEAGWDLLILPTVTRQTPEIGELMLAKGTDLEGRQSAFISGSLRMLAFTVPFNVSGQPAISLPIGMSSDGMPIGVQIVAAYGREDLLLQVAAQLEGALPWVARRPQLLNPSRKIPAA